MTILVIEENKEPYIMTIWKKLDELRTIIGNQEIEVIEYEKALLVYDEDAMKKLLPINRYIDNKAIRGIFILAGNNDKVQDFDDLSEEQIKKYTEQFTLEREVEIELE